VLVEFTVSIKGKGQDPRVIESSGDRTLDKAAVKALKRCKFKPAIKKWKTY
jgi:TonB family protein